MATIRVLAERVSGARSGVRDDVISGPENDLKPLVDSGAAEWADGRDDALTVDRTTWAWNVGPARERIAAEDDAATLREWHAGELRNPDYPPTGRKGVKDAITKRLGAIKADHAAEDAADKAEA